jgi:pimeloyl-ACP methyl ester carboxylesterase
MPSAARKGYVDTRHGQLHVWTIGQGPPLVCLHQASQDSTEFRDLAPVLAAHHKLVMVDLPGHGQSFDPPHEYDVPDYVAAIVEGLHGLGLGRVAVLGHHSGAVFALEMAARHPALVNAVILSGISWRSTDNAQALIAARAERHLPVTADGQFLAKMWDTYVSLVASGRPVDSVLEPYLVNQLMRLRPFDAHNVVLAWDKSSAVSTVRCPVLVLQGEEDVFVVGQDKLMTLLPHAQRKIIPGAGAFTFRDRPQETAQVIATFLSA